MEKVSQFHVSNEQDKMAVKNVPWQKVTVACFSLEGPEEIIQAQDVEGLSLEGNTSFPRSS